MSLQHRKAMALLIFGAAVIIFFSLSLSDSRKIRVRVGASRMRNVTVFNHGPGKNQKMKRSAQPEGLIFESKHKRKAPSNDSDYEPKNSTREKAMDTRSTEDMEMWGRQMRSLKAQIAETQKEIQAVAVELKEMKKKLEDDPAREATLRPAAFAPYSDGITYVKALLEAKEETVGDSKDCRHLPMTILNLNLDVNIPGFKKILLWEKDQMEERGIKFLKIFGRKSYFQVVKYFRQLRDTYASGKKRSGNHATLVGQSGIGKSFAFSQVYQRKAFKEKERVAFYSVADRKIYLYSVSDGEYTCRMATVGSFEFWESDIWRTFDSRSTHLIIDPGQNEGHGYYLPRDVLAFVLYLSSPNKQLSDFSTGTLRDLPQFTVYVPRLSIDEMRCVGRTIGLGEKEIEKRFVHTGGELRPCLKTYDTFLQKQNDDWNRVRESSSTITIGSLTAPSKIFAIEPQLSDCSELYGTNFIILPHSTWILNEMLQRSYKKVCRQFTGMQAEKWFLAELTKNCTLEATRLPKLSESEAKLRGWKTKEKMKFGHKSVKSWQEGTTTDLDECRNLISSRGRDDMTELIVCPPNFPAFDGASNNRLLYQVTLSESKEINQNYLDEIKLMNATSADKVRVVFVVPKRTLGKFSIYFKGGRNNADAVKTPILELAEFWVVGIDIMGILVRAYMNEKEG